MLVRSMSLRYTPSGDTELSRATLMNPKPRQFTVHIDKIYEVAFSPDGKYFATFDLDRAARLHIQEGYSQFLPANTMEAWVTDWGEELVPLVFRFHVIMCGSLGVGGNLLAWDQADRDSAVQYMSNDKSEGLLFVFRTYIRDPLLRGKYRWSPFRQLVYGSKTQPASE